MLKDLVKSRKKEGYAIPILEQQTLVEGYRDRMKRSRGVFHPSEICGDWFCPREWLLCERDRSLYLKRKVNVNTQMRFDVGKWLHRMVQEKLGNAGVLFGRWKCLRRCLDEKCIQFGFKPGRECPEADKRGTHALWVFDELPVQDDELLIDGSTDGLLVTKGCKYVFEFKTMYDDGFATLMEPPAEHKEQGLWYLDVLERRNRELETFFMETANQGLDVSRQLEVVRMPFSGVVILYMNKNDQTMREFLVRGKRPPTWEFLVKADDPVRDVIEEKREVLKQTLVHKENQTLPPRLARCSDKTAYRAKMCLARKECFECKG